MSSTPPTKKFLAMVALVALVACSRESSPAEEASVAPAGALVVYTTNYPLAFMAERVAAGSREPVHVTFPAPPDVDPASWSPGRAVVADYQRADLVLRNGASYEKWVQRASLPLATQVDTSKSFAERLIAIENAVEHSHGPQGAHSHSGTAFTTWLDPVLATAQAKAVRDALVRARPNGAEGFHAGFDALAGELADLDRELRAVFAEAPRRPLLASHPVYQYLARAFELNLESVHWEPGEAPDAAGWTELDALLAEHPATVMLWEGEPLAQTAELLARRGVRVAVFDPCGNRPAQGDYLAAMRANAARLAELLAEGS